MIRNRSARSLVAFITALLLLMCQTAFAAQACAHSFTPAAADVMTAPCHATADSVSPQEQAPVSSTSCEVANALSDAAKAPVLDITDLPAVVVRYLNTPAPQSASRALQTVHVCYSPPLSILHCRFLN